MSTAFLHHQQHNNHHNHNDNNNNKNKNNKKSKKKNSHFPGPQMQPMGPSKPHVANLCDGLVGWLVKDSDFYKFQRQQLGKLSVDGVEIQPSPVDILNLPVIFCDGVF